MERGAVSIHKTTQYSDRLLDHVVNLRTLARALLQPQMSEQQRMAAGFDLGDHALRLGELSEAIRTGRRLPEGEENEKAA